MLYHKNGNHYFTIEGALTYTQHMTSTQIGYARCSTDKQDLNAQREAMIALGVDPDRIYTDHGLTGRTRARPGLDQALAAVREGDTLVVTKLDRLARSAPDAREIADGLAERGIRLALWATVNDPTDPMGKMFFNILATFAEFESDLIRMRTREGMKIARAKGKLRGKKPKLSEKRAPRAAPHERHRRLLDQRPRGRLRSVQTDHLQHASAYSLAGWVSILDGRPQPRFQRRTTCHLD